MPGGVWAMSLDQLALLPPAPVSIVPLDRREANELLVGWGHYLGGCDRPFGQQAWALLVEGVPVSVSVSASIVSPRIRLTPGVDGERRCGGVVERVACVELARLCSAPGAAWATRVMLRCWREVLADRWPYWPAPLRVAYSQSDRHEGRIYRHDGWTSHGRRKVSQPGPASRSNARPPGDPGRGPKVLWTFGTFGAAA